MAWHPEDGDRYTREEIEGIAQDLPATAANILLNGLMAIDKKRTQEKELVGRLLPVAEMCIGHAMAQDAYQSRNRVQHSDGFLLRVESAQKYLESVAGTHRGQQLMGIEAQSRDAAAVVYVSSQLGTYDDGCIDYSLIRRSGVDRTGLTASIVRYLNDAHEMMGASRLDSLNGITTLSRLKRVVDSKVDYGETYWSKGLTSHGIMEDEHIDKILDQVIPPLTVELTGLGLQTTFIKQPIKEKET